MFTLGNSFKLFFNLQIPSPYVHLNGHAGPGIITSQQLSTNDRQSLLNVQQRGFISTSNLTTQNVALSILRLISCDRDSNGRHQKIEETATEENYNSKKKLKKNMNVHSPKRPSPIPPPPPSPATSVLNQRKRHSLLNEESPLVSLFFRAYLDLLNSLLDISQFKYRENRENRNKRK